MSKYFIISAIITLCLTNAHAAEISIQQTDKNNKYIQIIGEIEPSDGQTFKELVYRYRPTEVLLDSPGGSLSVGLSIGQTIRELGINTLVPSNAICYSACAIAWLGGLQRYITKSSEVGFHAAYKIENERKIETGVGNALVGAYFTRIGLPEKAVAFLTAAPPEKLLRLTPELASDIGVSLKLIDDKMFKKRAYESSSPQFDIGKICLVADPSTTPLNIRNEENEIIGTIANGEEVKIEQTRLDNLNKSWVLISRKNKIVGWVFRKYLDCNSELRTLPANKLVYYCTTNLKFNGDNWVALRSDPSTDTGYRIRKIGPNVRLELIRWADQGRWAYVRTSDRSEGYISSHYIHECAD